MRTLKYFSCTRFLGDKQREKAVCALAARFEQIGERLVRRRLVDRIKAPSALHHFNQDEESSGIIEITSIRIGTTAALDPQHQAGKLRYSRKLVRAGQLYLVRTGREPSTSGSTLRALGLVRRARTWPPATGSTRDRRSIETQGV